MYNYSTGFVIFIFSLLFIFFFDQDAAAQNKNTPVNIEVKSSIYAGSEGALPFWLHTNRDGKVDSSSANWINEIGFRADVADYGNLSVDIGGNLVGRISKNSSAHFSELYLHANLGGYRLSAGRFPDPIGLNNHKLSVGSMMVSRNTTPIPKISISTPEFLDVPYTNGHLQYKGMFSHGWLGENRFVSNPLLHQKYLYLKINVGDISATGGIVHNVIWSGRHPELGPLGFSFKEYVDVVLGKGADIHERGPTTHINEVIGNSVAAYEFGLAYETKKYKLAATRLFYLETKANTGFRNPWDGVWGLNIKFKKNNTLIDAVLYEYIYTRWQDNNDVFTIGSAGYYDNGIFESGWTYANKVLGLPLIKFDEKRETNKITNSILLGHHLGLGGKIYNRLGYKLLLTYSRNYGTNPDNTPNDELNLQERRTDQYSYSLIFSYLPASFENIQINMGLAGDRGELYPDQIGGFLGITMEVY